MRLQYCLLILTLCIALTNAHADGGPSEFAEGSAAYKAGDYATALSHFDRALAAGNQQPTLIYNRAVTLYKLERLGEAQRAFILLLNDSKWHDIALFNLARIDERLGEHASALARYRLLVKSTQNTRLRELAMTKEAALQQVVRNGSTPVATPKSKAISRGAMLLNFGTTYDDNASGLANDIVNQTQKADDVYFSTALYSHYYLSGGKNHGTKVYGLSQMRRFNEFQRFDTDVTGVGFATERSEDKWQWAFGTRLLNLQTDLGKLADQYGVSATATRRLSSTSISLLYQLNYFDAGQKFKHIDGWQNQIKMSGKFVAKRLILAPTLSYEINDRENREVEQRYFSYSPTVLGLDLDAQWQINQRWRAYASAGWQQAEYSKAHRIIDIGGVEREQQRAYQRRQLLVGAKYQFAPHWSLKAQWSTTQSDDTFDLYSYEKNAVSASVEYAK